MNNESLPHAEASEKSLLSSLWRSPEEVDGIIKAELTAQSFYLPECRELYNTLTEMIEERTPIEYETIKDALKRRKRLEDVGGIPFLNEVWNMVPTAANADYYIKVLREQEIRRTLILGADYLQKRAFDLSLSEEDLLADAENLLLHLGRRGSAVKRDMRARLDRYIDGLSVRAERLAENGFFFGVPALDRSLGAIQPGEYVVISAETSGGKSMLAFQGALYAAKKGMATVAFSFEMSDDQLFDRIFSHLGRISMTSFRKGTFEKGEHGRLMLEEYPRLRDLPFYLEETRDNDIGSVASRLRQMKHTHDIKLAVVDYLQRVRPSSTRRDGARYQEVADVSDRLKTLAMQLDIVIIAPCQLNRQGETRETASIEHDADVHIKIVEEKEDKRQNENDVYVWVEKNRQGKRHYCIPLRMDGEFMTVGERTTTHDE